VTIQEIIDLLNARLNYLAAQRVLASSTGDIAQVISIDEEAGQTAETLARIESA
jgi:hypothetical protein